jgi:hypothetical protein
MQHPLHYAVPPTLCCTPPKKTLRAFTSGGLEFTSSPLPPSRVLPVPQREEPTLKEKLVDRERQRRKEAERARLKRQFALMSNGGGLVYDGAASTGALRENGSITGTVGEESSVAAHADLEDSILLSPSHPHHSRHQGDQSPKELGYTMERFLQERGGGTQQPPSVLIHLAASTTSSVIREEAIEGEPNPNGAPDKGVVMERFLNEPILLEPAASLQEDAPPSSRPDDVHRSVSFDMELRTSQNNDDYNNGQPTTNVASERMTDQLHLSLDDSNASVKVEVADDDDLLDPVSPSERLSLPSEMAPSSMDLDGHRRGGPSSLDQQSTSTNPNTYDDDTPDQPRVLRLTEAEIQEMASIEEASIGNAPPSDRDEESLVGELVGEFGTAGAGGVDAAGTSFSQGTPTTALESGSILSGNQMSAQPSTMMHDDRDRNQHHRHQDMDDIDQNSIDEMVMSASVSSHLVVSPGASVSGSAVSVTANPPSEIIGRGEPTPTLPDDDGVDVDDDDNDDVSNPPPPGVIGSHASSPPPPSSLPRVVVAENELNSNNHDLDQPATSTEEVARMPPASLEIGDSTNSMQIREELKASAGPSLEGIVNRRLRPGMVPASLPMQPQSPMRRITSLPDKINNTSSFGDTPRANRTVDEFDFDKNDLPMSPRSLLSDSIRDLPGDDFWTSPGRKISVSPIHQGRPIASPRYQRDPKLDPLMVPPMAPSGMRPQQPLMQMPSLEEDPPVPQALLSQIKDSFGEVLASKIAAVEAKESEIYCREALICKGEQVLVLAVPLFCFLFYLHGLSRPAAFPKRLLPLILTLVIEIPVMSMIYGGSDRLCALLGRQHQQLLMGFIPLIAAVSGNVSSQASSLTTRAISNGHVTAKSYHKWLINECKVAAMLGVAVGAVAGTLAFFASATRNVPFAVTVAVAQTTSSTSAGCIGCIAPLVICFLLKRNANTVGGLVETAVQDVIASFITAVVSYYMLLAVVSPVEDPIDSCNSIAAEP